MPALASMDYLHDPAQMAAVQGMLADGLLTAREEAELTALLTIEDYEAAEASLIDFVQSAWPIIERGRKFKKNWHHEAICDHLEAVTKGEITRLVINIPPRCTKSTIVAVLWPAWVWAQDGLENQQFLSGSHNLQLATRDTMKTRRILESPWYRERWGDRIQFRKDQNQKTRYELVSGGHRIAFGFGSGVTGEGGDKIIVDDPHSAKEGMWSETTRKADSEFFDQELSTRLNDSEKSAIVIIMQRLHQADLSGHVLGGEEDWVHLRLPMEYSPEKKCRTMVNGAHFFEDPRTEPGELLHEERFPKEAVRKIKRRLGTWGVAGQFDQSPSPIGGGIVKLHWFRRYGVLPAKNEWLEVVQCWDTAQKPDELLNAPWVCGTWVVTETGFYLKDVYREWLDYPAGKRMAESLWKRDNPNAVVIEDKSTGSSLIQELLQNTSMPIVAFEPEGDKVTRLAVESPAIEAGHVHLPTSAPWLPDFEGEIVPFPASATKDQADMLSMSLKYFREGGVGPQIIEDLFDF